MTARKPTYVQHTEGQERTAALGVTPTHSCTVAGPATDANLLLGCHRNTSHLTPACSLARPQVPLDQPITVEGLRRNETSHLTPACSSALPQVPLDQPITVEGLRRNETYIFAVAAYDESGALLGGLGTSSREVCAEGHTFIGLLPLARGDQILPAARWLVGL